MPINMFLKNKLMKLIRRIIYNMLDIYPILCRAGTMDNYSYLLVDKESLDAAIVDPSETAPIVAECEKHHIKPKYIFNTHHHFDHTDSNLDIKNLFQAKVVANKADSHRISGFDIAVQDGDDFWLGKSQAKIMDVSAHTQGHILWYFPQDKALFTGDTLFNLCVGGLFEGSVEEMFEALAKIKSLPDDTSFYPGHEYTMHGAYNALRLMPDSKDLHKYIQKAQQKLALGLPVAPVTLGEEKCCNPYLMAENLQKLKHFL